MYLVRQGGKPLLTVRLGGLRGWLGRWLGGSPAGWLEPRQGQGRGCGSGRRYLPTYLSLSTSIYLPIYLAVPGAGATPRPFSRRTVS